MGVLFGFLIVLMVFLFSIWGSILCISLSDSKKFCAYHSVRVYVQLEKTLPSGDYVVFSPNTTYADVSIQNDFRWAEKRQFSAHSSASGLESAFDCRLKVAYDFGYIIRFDFDTRCKYTEGKLKERLFHDDRNITCVFENGKILFIEL